MVGPGVREEVVVGPGALETQGLQEGPEGPMVKGLGGSAARGSVCAMEAREEMIGRYLYEVRSVIKRAVRCKFWICFSRDRDTRLRVKSRRSSVVVAAD